MGNCDSNRAKNNTKNKQPDNPIIDKMKDNSSYYSQEKINEIEEKRKKDDSSYIYNPNIIYIPFTIDYSRKLEVGIFYNIYAGTFLPTKEKVSIKIQKTNKYNYFSNEIKIYKKLN